MQKSFSLSLYKAWDQHETRRRLVHERDNKNVAGQLKHSGDRLKKPSSVDRIDANRSKAEPSKQLVRCLVRFMIKHSSKRARIFKWIWGRTHAKSQMNAKWSATEKLVHFTHDYKITRIIIDVHWVSKIWKAGEMTRYSAQWVDDYKIDA